MSIDPSWRCERLRFVFRSLPANCNVSTSNAAFYRPFTSPRNCEKLRVNLRRPAALCAPHLVASRQIQSHGGLFPSIECWSTLPHWQVKVVSRGRSPSHWGTHCFCARLGRPPKKVPSTPASLHQHQAHSLQCCELGPPGLRFFE